MKSFVAFMAGVGFILVGLAAPAHSAEPVPDQIVVVTDPSMVPKDAIQTSQTVRDCETTTKWALSLPATEDKQHEEARYKRIVPAVAEESHEEWAVEERTRTAEEGVEYHFRKFTQTRTQPFIEGQEQIDHWWNWSPNHTSGPQDYVPDFPEDSRGEWQGPHVNGGPMQDTYGTFQTGGGNSPFFHRERVQDGTADSYGEWTAWSDWTAWTPETHTSWQDSPEPLGVPQYHGSGTYDDGTKWERQWQARFDGQTRPNGVVSYGDWTEWEETQSGLTEEPEVPADTDTHEYRVTGPVKVVDVEAVSEYTEYFTGAGNEPSRNIEDAVWVPDVKMPGRPWAEFERRTVTVKEGTPARSIEYVYKDGEECEKPNPPVKHNTPPTPDVPVSVDAGLTGTPAGSQNGPLALLMGGLVLIAAAGARKVVMVRSR